MQEEGREVNRTLLQEERQSQTDRRETAKPAAAVLERTETAEGMCLSEDGDGKYLFTTASCPNCRIAKEMLQGEAYEVIDAEKEPELAKQYHIMQAPTLVVVDHGTVTKYVNASNIQRYVDGIM